MFRSRQELKEYNYSKEELAKFAYAKITTDKGIIWIKLFNEETPNTVANFATLVNDGFYNGLNFHRVIPGFMAQGGCPDGTGMGGPDWAIKCEIDAPKQVHNRGSLSMAHAGRNTGGSQFFICFVPCPHLDRHHTVFGGIEVTDKDSFKTLDSITQGDKIVSIEILESK
ncbi:peptidylprolyl isomerase [Aliarcobacter butzleri]|uniref:Peptidyl-prolyl cis-trans isomerase n=1 Tax=Aliarcobacter butzleri L352 TaxID=1447260 RepID=A0A837JBV1_9BACT|nr:peptidylprolyl isomerase [Aliarcobacter butzleri]KLE04666.1 peptidylprolyl isomerase [Aliarcobacter butzleri L352]KLE11006.1 peptidylprolyl isomerase [Aliarcobacter butzleri L354]MCG3654935.1 peptidylprolyl isomerase [Aliarcobacter butzleri]MCG3694978.1 peptidylprolyl isomerase [Aliarcobacter butzleri]MCG3706330.1 peptidylprolyl isomerase [Aliarcobacter butzleri]